MNTFSMKRVALFLFAGVLSLTVLQTAAAQAKHTVDVKVQKINEIVAPGDVTINIDPSNGNFTGTATTSDGYDVTSNVSGGAKVQVQATNTNNTDQLNSLKILEGGTDAPGSADANTVTLVDSDGTTGGPQALTNSNFTGVDVDNLSVEFEAEVSPDFKPNKSNTSVTVQYTLTSTGGGN
ncbi:hypothetical protein [Salinibacter ruber]|uniref:WxL domain-containing protein n=1 Tax=Salinibacter ruber TaxID=146919 RepID=A0A9X2V7P3_9BACT|nr:hypothetical protein [Salinibacter ruber]MCS3672461.1 hypothetical protein [Salinibacter ruber]MCS4122774.1 hypothetical protein [Salinibacter ruber]MCS4136437.1 hypothetical protein [Salinibacter ruber]